MSNRREPDADLVRLVRTLRHLARQSQAAVDEDDMPDPAILTPVVRALDGESTRP